MCAQGTVTSRGFHLGAIIAVIGLIVAGPARAATEPLRFTVTDVREDDGTVRAKPPSGAAIDRDAIVGSASLRAALKAYFGENATFSRTAYGDKKEINEIKDIAILDILGNEFTLRVKYGWIIYTYQRTGIDTAIFSVTAIPEFSNFKYPSELFSSVDDSYYPDIAEEIEALGLPPESERGDKDCRYDHFAPNPCPGTLKLLKVFAARQGLEITPDTSAMFRAYVNRSYDQADRLYAKAKGYRIPAYRGVGEALTNARAKLLQAQSYKRNFDCEYNYYSPNPCPGVLGLWRDFAKSQNLPLDPLSAGVFEAYASRDFKRGDRLYAVAKGLPIPGYRGPGESVLARRQKMLQIQSYKSSRGGCAFNHFDPNPCPETISLWRAFTEKNGLEMDYASADIFESYANGNYTRGDRLYARAKNIPVSELASRGAKPPPPPMIIDIRPSTTGATPAL